MSRFLVIISILFSLPLLAEELTIFQNKVKLNESCVLEVNNVERGNSQVSLEYIGQSNCSLVKYWDTDVIHLERVNNKYVVLVESQKNGVNDCSARYSAIVFHPDGTVEPINYVKKSGTCGIDREKKEFDYFEFKSTRR